MNPVELIKFVREHFEPGSEQLQALAALSDAPPEDYKPVMQLPVQNELPAFKIGDGSPGSLLLNQGFGVPAPVFGQEGGGTPTIGQLLIGEM